MSIRGFELPTSDRQEMFIHTFYMQLTSDSQYLLPIGYIKYPLEISYLVDSTNQANQARPDGCMYVFMYVHGISLLKLYIYWLFVKHINHVISIVAFLSVSIWIFIEISNKARL